MAGGNMALGNTAMSQAYTNLLNQTQIISDPQYFSLRWNNYQSNMTSVFHQLLESEAFVDVTLACERDSLKAHKVC